MGRVERFVWVSGQAPVSHGDPVACGEDGERKGPTLRSVVKSNPTADGSRRKRVAQEGCRNRPREEEGSSQSYSRTPRPVLVDVRSLIVRQSVLGTSPKCRSIFKISIVVSINLDSRPLKSLWFLVSLIRKVESCVITPLAG